MSSPHTFHIPVMGTAFTADSAIKVAHYGINTVIALADDVLLERLRKYYSHIYNICILHSLSFALSRQNRCTCSIHSANMVTLYTCSQYCLGCVLEHEK